VNWWAYSEAALLEQCDEDRYRASGPGGQHRNKTDSAVRLRHRATGVIVTGTETRSRHQNRARALRRLQAALAFRCRQPIDPDQLPAPLREWLADSNRELRPKRPEFLPVAASLLDLLEFHGGRTAESAACLGVGTAQFVRWLETSPESWQAAQEIRQRFGLRPLSAGD
jgi:hypothetical protein